MSRDLNDTLVFVKVVELGSFTAASRTLHLPKTTVSRKVHELEERLGAQLLHRTTRKLGLTEAGNIYFTHCQRIARDLDDLHGRLSAWLAASAPGASTPQVSNLVVPEANGMSSETFLFDVVDGDKDIRIAVPNGSIVERGEITYLNNDAVGYPVTIQANPGPNGIRAIKYFSDLDGLPTVDPEA